MTRTDRTVEMLPHRLPGVPAVNNRMKQFSRVRPVLGPSGSITPACRMSVPTGVPVARSASVHPPVESGPFPVIGSDSTGLGASVVAGSPAVTTDSDGDRAPRCERAQVGPRCHPARLVRVIVGRCGGSARW
jgi:hypothetical protein